MDSSFHFLVILVFVNGLYVSPAIALMERFRQMADDAKEDELQPQQDNAAGLLTFHDCHASISWILEKDWSQIEEKREMLKRVIHEKFETKLIAKLKRIKNIDNGDVGGDEVEYNDKVMKQLLLMLYWLIKLFPNRLRSQWLTDIMKILVEYVRRHNEFREEHQERLTVFKYLDRVYGANMLWNGKDGDNLMTFISAICQRLNEVVIGDFLPCVLWYNACYQCADSEERLKVLHEVLY